ncbi:MAG: cytochrome P450 [Pseudonocardiaceae bacterium]
MTDQLHGSPAGVPQAPATAPDAQCSGPQDETSTAMMAVWGNPEMSANPQPMHQRLRAQGDTLRMGPMVMLNTRAAVDEALHRPEIFSSGMSSARLGNTRPLIPMQIDPPDHRAYRKLLDPLFGPKQIARLEPVLVEVVGRLIDGFAERGSCDFTEEFATPLPCSVFLALLGLPPEDLAALVRMKGAIVHPPRHDIAETERVQNAAGQELYDYFARALDAPRQVEGGLLARLLAADIDGRALTRDEIVDICYLLVLAGLDTITDTLTLGLVFLARNPEHRQAIVDDPELIPAAIEELLRWESPIPGVPRTVTAQTSVAGCPVAPGDLLYIGLGAANTDPATLPDAYSVRFDREPNRHLAFGGGIHRCLGARLARLELRIALREWHRRIPHYALPDGVELQYLTGLRSVEHLPLIFPPSNRRAEMC